MKIAFLSDKADINRGSFRIHIDNLNKYLNSINIYSEINPDNIDNFDVIIYDKSCSSIKAKNKLCGIITPSSDDYKLIEQADFIIVGSAEEKDSIINHNKNCFIFPQIEKMYQGIKPKIHTKKDKLIIGYHGNQNHLNHLELGLCNALEKLNEEENIKLVYICGKKKNEWINGIPKIELEFKRWNFDTIRDDILEFDIGIIPNISQFENKNTFDENLVLGKYSTDISIRFKNKSNIGRSLVLFQLGIPVVADITPSNMHILSNPDNGYAVLSEEGWYYALKELCCENRRNFIAKNAFEECNRLYNPIDWTNRLVKNLESLIHQKMKERSYEGLDKPEEKT